MGGPVLCFPEGAVRGVKFSNWNIQKKIIILSAFITFIPLLVLELVILNMVQENTFDRIMNMAYMDVDQLADSYQNELNKLEHIAKAIQNFTPLSQYLSMEFAGRGEEFVYYQENIHPFLRSCTVAYPEARIRIYHGKTGMENFSAELNHGLEEFLDRNPEDIINVNGAWKYVPSYLDGFHSRLVYCLPYYANKDGYQLFYLITIRLGEEQFQRQIANEQPGDRIVCVMDREGNVLADSVSGNEKLERIVRDVLSADEEGWEGTDTGKLSAKWMRNGEFVAVDGEKYCCAYRETEDLMVLYLVSYDSIRLARRNPLILLLVSACMMMAVSLTVIVYVSRRITAGLYSLKRKVQNIDAEGIHVQTFSDREQESADEIEQLNAAFTSMMEEIRRLLNDAALREGRLKDEIITRQRAELSALQRQIDPHYLFNTLGAIRMSLILKGNQEDAKIVQLFAESFRRYMDTGTNVVTLLEEVEFVQKYIRIQNYRLADKIQFDCRVDERLMSCRVRKLLLQPVIENAVCHGIEPQKGAGKIILCIQKEKKLLKIQVEDDGVGMDEQERGALRSRIYHEGAAGTLHWAAEYLPAYQAGLWRIGKDGD